MTWNPPKHLNQINQSSCHQTGSALKLISHPNDDEHECSEMFIIWLHWSINMLGSTLSRKTHRSSINTLHCITLYMALLSPIGAGQLLSVWLAAMIRLKNTANLYRRTWHIDIECLCIEHSKKWFRMTKDWSKRLTTPCDTCAYMSRNEECSTQQRGDRGSARRRAVAEAEWCL